MKTFLAKLALALKKPLAKLVVDLVAEAESRIPGETGADKKAYVIGRLDDLAHLPWFLEPFDNAIFEVLIDTACRLLNNWFGHEWQDKVKSIDLLVAADTLKTALKNMAKK